MQPWWWRSVAACGSVVAVAGLVAAVSGASDGDRAERDRSALTAAPSADPAPASPVAQASRDEPPRGAAPRPAAPEAPDRVVDRATGASVTLPPGWRAVPGQRVVPVPAGRFGTVLAAGERAVVLVGALDPTRVRTPATVAALEAEARRLAGAFADGAAPSATRVVPLRDDDAGVAGRAAATSLRRVDGGDRRTAGMLVRVSTVDAAPGARGGVVLLAVVLPGPSQAADARAAEAVVRSLEPVRPRQAPATPPRPSTGR